MTYAWYRFVDQPAIRYWAFSDDILKKLQHRVELVHKNWSLTDKYLSGPAEGELARFDEAQIVVPPAGLEIGYVPIVLEQRKSQ